MSEEQAFEQSGQSEANTEAQQIEQSGGGDANGTTENEDDRFLKRIFSFYLRKPFLTRQNC